MDSFLATLTRLGIVKLAIIAALLGGIASGFIYLTSRLATPEMALLYADLDMSDAGKIVSRLETMGVPVDVRGGGSQVLVPSDRVARLRIELAESGLPRGGSVGYEIFDNGENLGASSFVQTINHLRALEGELARTIGSIAQVASARVHLVLPRRKLFSRDREEPSASIMVTMAGAGTLPTRRVLAIQQLVAAAVPSLLPERVSIVDDRGNLLARGDQDSDMLSATNLEEKRLAYEDRLSRMIEGLVTKYVGEGKVRSEVSLDMDFDRITENSEIFDPDGQVIRSTQTVTTDEKSSESEQAVTVENNLPNAGEGGGSGTASQANRAEETVNYEISKKVKSHVRETGGIKRLSVAVLVDGNYTTPEGGGEPEYTPRSEEELATLTKLVKNAIGFNEERGDSIEVANMRFASLPLQDATGAPDAFLGLSTADLVRLAESLIIGVLGLMVFLMVIKPLVLRLLTSDEQTGVTGPQAIANEDFPTLTDESAANVLPPPVTQPAAPEPPPPPPPPPPPVAPKALEEMVSMQQFEGQVRASSLKTIGELVDENTESAVSVVRSWLHENQRGA